MRYAVTSSPVVFPGEGSAFMGCFVADIRLNGAVPERANPGAFYGKMGVSEAFIKEQSV